MSESIRRIENRSKCFGTDSIDPTCEGVAMLASEGQEKNAEHVAGIGINEAVAEWIRAALEIRIGDRAAGNDEQEAVQTVLEIVRDYTVDAAHSIVYQRRMDTIERELRRTPADKQEERRLTKMRRILRARGIG
jgi:hypothetical protein